jgi:hypothetical protein
MQTHKGGVFSVERWPTIASNGTHCVLHHAKMMHMRSGVLDKPSTQALKQDETATRFCAATDATLQSGASVASSFKEKCLWCAKWWWYVKYEVMSL